MLKELAFQISRRWGSTQSAAPSSESQLRSSTESYRNWRQKVLRDEFLRFFEPDIVRGKDVLDFGCGGGDLSFLMIELGASSAVGIDLNKRDIEIATQRKQGEPVSFIQASNTYQVDLSDAAVDVIACFDVMEHIMEYEAIMGEWHRVLRPGGRVLIHWQPWFHPYGHHGQSYIPIPWVHVFLNNRQRTEVCARLVELPEFNPPWWDIDKQGNRINRFRDALESGEADKEGFLNKLTMWRFEALCDKLGFDIEQKTLSSFQGPHLVRGISSVLTRIPRVREFFTANAVYQLSKRDLSA